MIPQETVQQILQAVDVVEVIGDYVSLSKRGASMIACCPFHNEKTPSFYVSPAKQIYKCFGCGKGGDSVRFIMDLEGLGYPEALKHLAKKYNIEIVEREFTDADVIAQNEKESLFIALEFAQNYYNEQLLKSSEGQSVGMSYFKERGYNTATIEKFNLGYSLEGWSNFTDTALKKGFSLDILEKAGLTIIKEGKDPIDRFRGRVIFPIHNVSGKPIAFGARFLKPDPKAPKYLNSPETEVYHKTWIVYGIFHAKSALRNEDNCFLVEGYTDVVSLNQAGIENVVASSGTSLTKEQIQLIRRFTNNITVLYDGDSAGIKASIRGIDLILEEGLNVKSVVFPDGEDPDSFVQKVGSDGFKNYIKENSKDFIKFKTELSIKEVGDDPVKKAGLITDLVETITKIPDAIKRAVFYKEVSNLLSIDEAILINEGNKHIKKKIGDAKKGRNTTGEPDFGGHPDDGIAELAKTINLEQQILDKVGIKYYHEEEFVRDLVCFGNLIIEKNSETGEEFSLADYLFHEIGDLTFEDPKLLRIFELYKGHYLKGELLNTQFFTSHPDSEIQGAVINWLSSKHELSSNWSKYEIFVPKYEDKLDSLSFKTILRIKKEKIESDINNLIAELDNANDDDQEVILTQIMQHKLLLKKISHELGSIV
jgi:DNA primase